MLLRKPFLGAAVLDTAWSDPTAGLPIFSLTVGVVVCVVPTPEEEEKLPEYAYVS